MSCVIESEETISYKFVFDKKRHCPISNVFVHVDKTPRKQHTVTIGISQRFKNPQSFYRVLEYMNTYLQTASLMLMTREAGEDIIPWFIDVPRISSATRVIQLLFQQLVMDPEDQAFLEEIVKKYS